MVRGVHGGGGYWLLLVAMLQCVPAIANRLDRVEAACRLVYIHGINAELTQRTLEPEDIASLHGLLRNPSFERRDNVVAFLIYAGDSSTVPELRRLLEEPPTQVATPEEDRAFLMVPEALAALAARGSSEALELLLEISMPGSESGPLRRGVRSGNYGEGLRQDLIERSNRALDRIDEEERPTEVEVSRGASESLDSNSRIHEAGLSYSQHESISTESRMTDAIADDLMQRASELAGRADFVDDIACCITIRRNNNGSLFTGAGLEFIDSLSELDAVFAATNARVKIVRLINWCDGTGSNIIGCAEAPGNSMVVVRMSDALSEAKLWLHEYGHNTGILHNITNSLYLMYPVLSVTGSNTLNSAECNTFHSPSPLASSFPIDIGVCEDFDADQIASSIDNCPTIANFEQDNLDTDEHGDVCDNCPDTSNSRPGKRRWRCVGRRL